MRFSTTTLVFLVLATLTVPTTASTGHDSCAPLNWPHGQIMSFPRADAPTLCNLPRAAPNTTALNITCLGGLLAPTSKVTFPLVDLEGMGSKTISVPWAATTTQYCVAFAVPGVTVVPTLSYSTEMVEKFVSKWYSSSPSAILWFDMGFRYCPACPAGIPPPRPRVAKGALQAMLAAAFGEVKSFIVAQLRAWGFKMLLVSALFAAPWKAGITTFVRAYAIVKSYAPMLFTGLLCVYTAIALLIGVGGMVVIGCNTCWHMKENIFTSQAGLKTVLEENAQTEGEETEEEDWVMVEAEEEIDESSSTGPTEEETIGEEEHSGGLGVFSLLYIGISVAVVVFVLAVFVCIGALASNVWSIVTTTNKATSTAEEEEERDLLLDGLLGEFAPVLPGLALAGFRALVSYIRPLLSKENIAAVMDAIATLEHSIQPLYEDLVNVTWYVLAGLALLAAAFVVLLARVALWTIMNVLCTSAAEEEEEEEGDAATYSNLSSLGYLAAVLTIPGSFYVAGITFVMYLALPDGPNEKRLSFSANNDGSGADSERFRSESGLPSGARRGLQRVSVSLGVGRTSSAEAIKKEEGEEVMADGC